MKKFLAVLFSVLFCPLSFLGLFALCVFVLKVPQSLLLVAGGYALGNILYILLLGKVFSRRLGLSRRQLGLWMTLLGYPLCWVALLVWIRALLMNLFVLLPFVIVTGVLAVSWGIVGLLFLVVRLFRTPPKVTLRRISSRLAAVWGILRTVLLVAAVAGVLMGARGYYGLRSPEEYIDKGVYTFTASTCYPHSVKTTGRRGRQQTRTVYVVTYKSGDGYTWTEEVGSKSAGDRYVKERRKVERRVLSTEERTYITVEPEYTAESYIQKEKSKYLWMFGVSAAYLTGGAVWLIWKKRQSEVEVE